MQFEWDATKAAANLAKHGVSFERAILVFDDPAHFTTVDTRHTLERRDNTTGLIADLLLFTVTFAAVSHSENCGQTPGGQQAATAQLTAPASPG